MCVCVCGVKLTPGQLVVASLMERGHSVRAIIRNAEKGKALFGEQDPQQFQVFPLDQQLLHKFSEFLRFIVFEEMFGDREISPNSKKKILTKASFQVDG